MARVLSLNSTPAAPGSWPHVVGGGRLASRCSRLPAGPPRPVRVTLILGQAHFTCFKPPLQGGFGAGLGGGLWARHAPDGGSGPQVQVLPGGRSTDLDLENRPAFNGITYATTACVWPAFGQHLFGHRNGGRWHAEKILEHAQKFVARLLDAWKRPSDHDAPAPPVPAVGGWWWVAGGGLRNWRAPWWS